MHIIIIIIIINIIPFGLQEGAPSVRSEQQYDHVC
jgi:hypothetical protein